MNVSDHHLQSCALKITEMKCVCLVFSSYISIQKKKKKKPSLVLNVLLLVRTFFFKVEKNLLENMVLLHLENMK